MHFSVWQRSLMHENDDPAVPFEAEGKPSKSARKRAMHNLQELGGAISGLKPEQIRALQLPERLEKEILEFKRLKSREAMRRQAQFIGKLMREVEDVDDLQGRFEALTAASSRHTAQFKEAERWRDLLLDDPDSALERFFQRFPDIDRATMTKLVGAAREDRLRGQNRGNGRQLFRFIFALLS